MNSLKFQAILNLVQKFSKEQKEILALALCGSWARGNPHDRSDIDFIFIVKDKFGFKRNDWLKQIDLSQIDETILHFKDMEYGQVWSRHVFLKSQIEIEFSFANINWANVPDIHEGTEKVVRDGFKILYDPKLILHNLVKPLK